MSTTVSAAGTREVFQDDRGSSRVLRLSWHPEHRLVVFSLWSNDVCQSSFRLPADQVPAFVHVLTSGLAELGATPSVPTPRCETTANPPDEPGVPSRPSTGDARDLVVGGLTRVLDGVATGCTRLGALLDRTRRDS